MKTTPLDKWICQKISCSTNELSRQAVENYQISKINDLLRYVRSNNPFYKDFLLRSPEKISNLSALADIPFTTAEDIRNHGKDLICVSQGDISRIVTMQTSGTTDQPKRIYFTPRDQELTIDFFGVGMSTLVEAGDRVLILLPDSITGSVGDLLFTGLERIGAIPIKHGPVVDLAETLSIISGRQVDSLVGVPTQVLALCNYYLFNLDTFPVQLKSILLSTDHVPLSLAERLERSWHCRVFNHYGMTEMGLGGGVFCEANYGYHLREADMLFEVIDPNSGKQLPEGKYGELVFTTLTREGMPLIRYRTGDRARFLNSPCPCGSKLRSLERITGRVDQAFALAGVPFHLSEFDEILFAIDHLINFDITISTKDGLDLLSLQLNSLSPIEDLRPIITTLREYLSTRTVDLNRMGLSIRTVVGFPSNLSSMRKRKINFSN